MPRRAVAVSDDAAGADAGCGAERAAVAVNRRVPVNGRIADRYAVRRRLRSEPGCCRDAGQA